MLFRRGMTPKYDLVQIEGAVHEPTFKYRQSKSIDVENYTITPCWSYQIRSDPKINSFVEKLLIIFIKYPQIVSTIMTRILFRVTIGEFVATGCGQSKKKAKHSAAKVGTLMISYHQFNYMNPSLMCLLSARKNKRCWPFVQLS